MNNHFFGSHLGRNHLRILLPFLMLILLLAPPQAGAEVYTGNLGGIDNVWEQWLPVTIPSDGTFTTQMAVTGDLNGGNSGHYLYDSTKTYNYPYSGWYTSPLGPWGLKAGDYYLKVWTNNPYGRGTYTVTTTFTSQPLANDAEPNDAYAQAGTLSTSGSVTGHLGYWNIVGSQDYQIDWEDWWRLTLPSAGKLNLTYTYDQALAGATGIYLYAQDGSTQISDTDSTLAAGTYYLRAWDNSSNAFGGYTITLDFNSYFETVQKIYIGYYQRPADPGGLIYWAGRLDSSGGNLSEIIEAFANSAESQALYGTINSGNIPTVVNDIYKALLARDAEDAGRDWYVGEFNAGRITAATIMLNVMNGAQNEDLQSINNKVTAANLFTRAIDPELDGSNFQVTYAGDGDIIAARNFVALVTSNSTTVPTQAATTEYIRANVADPGDAILAQ